MQTCIKQIYADNTHISIEKYKKKCLKYWNIQDENGLKRKSHNNQ